MDRPLFYAVAVIVASFLPIYVLAGPSGTLFRPMADTMIFALVGALIVTLTLLPVLCAWFMRKGVRERRNAAFEAMQARLHARARLAAWRVPGGRPWPPAVLLALSLLLIPRIGAEFMPHLDEGALWVRATMPYTISFDESAKIAPQIRDILRSFPEVTTVASELGRPDDGTDPTGFFNVEFFVGLKPYSRVERRATATRPALIEAIDRKLQVIPGHHLQLHPAGRGRGGRGRDGPEERAGGQGLRRRPRTRCKHKGKAIKQILRAGARHHAT